MAAIDLQHVTRLADRLSPADKQGLIDHLVRQLQREGSDTPGVSGQTVERPQSLRGIWQGKFPEEFDLDAALDEIRHEWELVANGEDRHHTVAVCRDPGTAGASAA